jgi:hypothetical protein
VFVRIARFEGAADIDGQIAAVEEAMETGPPLPHAKWGKLLVDRDAGKTAFIVFTDTAEQMAELHAALNDMSPTGGGGTRVSADVYEVALEMNG